MNDDHPKRHPGAISRFSTVHPLRSRWTDRPTHRLTGRHMGLATGLYREQLLTLNIPIREVSPLHVQLLLNHD